MLICEDSLEFPYWNKIIEQKSSDLLTLAFGTKTCHRINATIIKNFSRDAFINVEYDNNLIDYHVLEVGGAAVSLSFLDCVDSTSIKLRFS